MLSPNRNLTPSQSLAAESIERPTAVVAAAGSGKTTVLVERYLQHLRAGVAPDRILTVTFTTEAALEMKKRILAYFENSESVETRESIEQTRDIGTMHSFCYRVLNQYGSTIGAEPIREILSPFQLAQAVQSEFQIWLSSLGPEELGLFLNHYSHRELRDLFREVYSLRFSLRKKADSLGKGGGEDGRVLESISKYLLPAASLVESRLTREGIYSFDELEELTLQILEKSPEALNPLRQRYEAFLVDEFQDTNPNQWKIIQLLLPKDWRGLFIVGDPKQSIYRFRQADVRLFPDAVNEIKKRDGHLVELSSNFRSQAGLLKSLNQFSQNLFLGAEVEHQEMENPLGGEGEFLYRLYEGADRKEAHGNELRLVASDIKALRERSPEDSIALLFRMADRMGDFESAIPYPVSSQSVQQVFESYDVWGVVHYLKCILDPLDDFELGGFLRSPFMNFTQSELWALKKSGPLVSGLSQSRGAWILELVERGEMDVSRLLTSLFEKSRHLPESPAFQLFLEALSKAPRNLPACVDAVEAWEKEAIHSVPVSAPEDKGIRLMTIHASKGLEFDHVFLVDFLRNNPNRLPLIKCAPNGPIGLRYRLDGEFTQSPVFEGLKKLEGRAEAEESKRILYVAATRAKKSLRVYLPMDEKLARKGTWAELLNTVKA